MDECTIAEIGVGADIAAGSQAVMGNWALFVIAHTMIITTIHFVLSSFVLMFMIEFIFTSIILITAIRITSPIRLNIMVITEFIFPVLFG